MRGSLLLLLLATACLGLPDAPPLLLDGGADAGADGDGCVPDAGPSDGGCALIGEAEACASLLAATCGETCAESPGCAAASLLGRYEPARCADALTDTQTFPVCQLGNCDALVAQACGGDPPLDACIDAPGCGPALDLKARASDADASQAEIDEAKASCLQALEDEVVFAPCP